MYHTSSSDDSLRLGANPCPLRSSKKEEPLPANPSKAGAVTKTEHTRMNQTALCSV